MRLILDENLSSAVGRGLETAGIDVIAVADWQDGLIRSVADVDILIAAAAERRVLVTFDLKTLRPLEQNDIGGIVRALRKLVAERGNEDWHDQSAFLQR